MDSWTKHCLSEISDVRDGTHDSPRPALAGYPLVTSKHIINNRVDLKDTYLISEDDYNAVNKRSKVDKYDILISMIGTVGEVALVKDEPKYAIKNVGLIKTNNEILSKYLFYYLLSRTGQNALKSFHSGATQKFISLGKLRSLPVFLPSQRSQENITSVLSAYDDLIEVNEKRIRVLEEMAQRLYTEWFVKFKFPGHEKTRMVDSGTEYGKIPEGWEVVLIGNRFSTILGGTPPRGVASYWIDGIIPWINSGKVNELRIIDESELITQEALDRSATKIMPKRTTLIAITGATLGQVSLTEIVCCANQSVVGVYDEEGLYSEFIFLKIKEIIRKIIALAGGGAQQHINKDIVNDTEILIPDKTLMVLFSNKIRPVFDEIAALMFHNKNMLNARDLLISQLVTGKRELK